MAKLTLAIESVTKLYGANAAINGVSLGVVSGEVLGLLGPTGAGKTTLIKLIGGAVMPDEGDITIGGVSMYRDFEACMKMTGVVLERPEFYNYMSGLKNLKLFAAMYGGISSERISEVAHSLNLDDYLGLRVGCYPAGVRQRLAIAAAMLHSPKLLVLDEALDGLDPVSVVDIRRLLRKLCAERGMSVIITSHQMSELERMCDRVAILDRGKLLGVGAVDKLKLCGAGRVRQRVKVDRPDAAARYINESLGYGVEVRGDDVIIETDQSNVPKIVSMLYNRSHYVYEIGQLEMTLEEAYYRLLRQRPAASAPAAPAAQEQDIFQPYDGGVAQ